MLPNAKKTVVCITPASFTNGATAGAGNTNEYVDTKGWKQADFSVILSAADVVSNAPSVLKVQEADVTNASSFADVSGFVGGTDFTIGSAYTNSAGQNVYNLNVPVLGGRKRYLRLQVSPRTTQIVAAVCDLSRGENNPGTAAQTGAISGVV